MVTAARTAPNAPPSMAGNLSAVAYKERISEVTLHNREKWGWLSQRMEATEVT